MRFNSIRIENLRAVREFSLEGLKDFIVVAGPNGCGKSCVFDAIRLLKSVYGGYQPQEHMQWFAELGVVAQDRSQILNIFRNRSRSVVISATISFSDEEKNYMKEAADDLVWPIAWQRVTGQPVDYWSFSRASIATQLAQVQQRLRPSIDELKARLTADLDQETYSISLEINTAGEFVMADCLPAEVSFSAFEPDHLGIVEYHSAARSYTRQPVQGINLDARAFADQRRQQTLYNAQAKYQNVKTELASGYLRTMIQEKAGNTDHGEDLNQTLKELFQTFFPDKVYGGVEALPQGSLAFPVHLPGGESHDIDDLSSGEKEILYGYLRLRNSTPRNSVILLDEPELHLNPSLLQGFADFYHRHLGVARANQLWLVTHSDTLLRQAIGNVNYGVYHMHSATSGGSGNQATEVLLESDVERVTVDLVGDLAAYRPHAKVVILEGANSDAFDETFIRRIFPDFAKRVNLVSGGSKQRVKDLWDVLNTSVEKSGIANRFFAILDKDTDARVISDETSKTYIWDAYHIENYLLDSSAIREAVKVLSPQLDLGDDQAIKDLLHEAAAELVDDLVLHKLTVDVNREVISSISVGGRVGTSAIGKVLLGSLTGSAERVSETIAGLTEDVLEARAEKHRLEYTTALSTDDWLKEIPGREILKLFVKRNVGDLKYETFRNVVLDQMQRSDSQPSSVKAVLEQILAA